MKDQDGFIKPILDNVNRFYKIGLKQIDWLKKIQGTKCVVTRINNESKYKDVFGSVVSSTLIDDNEVTEFNYVILINLNDMLKLFQKSITQLDFYDNNSVLKLGDVLKFSRLTQEFKYKIIDIQTFSESGYVLNRYTISGMVEVNSIK